MKIGDKVTVNEPFTRDFPNFYIIEEIHVHEDGTIVCILDQNAGGFDPKYLQVAE